MAARELHVIHSSVPVDRIAPDEEPPAIGPFRILYVGALEPKKGVEHLFNALVLVGAGWATGGSTRSGAGRAETRWSRRPRGWDSPAA